MPLRKTSSPLKKKVFHNINYIQENKAQEAANLKNSSLTASLSPQPPVSWAGVGGPFSLGSPYLTSVGVMEPGYHDRSWSLVLCLGRSKEHDGLQPHRPLIGGSGGGDTLDTQVKGKEFWLSPDGSDLALLRCQCVPGTLHMWLDRKTLLSS